MSQKPIVQRKSLSVATESELTMKARIIVDSVELNLKKIPVSQDGGYRRAADFATDRILHYRRLYGGSMEHITEQPRLMALLETAYLLDLTTQRADHSDTEESLARLCTDAETLLEQYKTLVDDLPSLS